MFSEVLVLNMIFINNVKYSITWNKAMSIVQYFNYKFYALEALLKTHRISIWMRIRLFKVYHLNIVAPTLSKHKKDMQ